MMELRGPTELGTQYLQGDGVPRDRAKQEDLPLEIDDEKSD